MNYDIIRDIHGYADQLEKLLEKLDYYSDSGIYKYPDQKKSGICWGFY